ncbi:MAG: DUF881 domain-containing protein [Anaerovoracaceae bacterium]|jgi:uncharacterized protein YlxW (UPF0749 family)
MKIRLKIVLIFILCVFIGSSVIVLSKTVKGLHLFVSKKVLEDYKITIEGERKDTEILLKQIEEKKAELEALEALEAANEDISRELESKLFQDLELYEVAGGFVDVIGPGVEVIIDDGTRDIEYWENPNDILVHDMDLLLIINDLKAAGAEVISVNGQRIVDTSAISCSGYTVRINGQFYARPFVIRAIGDGSRMAASLIGPGGYGNDLKDWGLVFKVTILDDIRIPAYTEDRTSKYMMLSADDKTVKEGENN